MDSDHATVTIGRGAFSVIRTLDSLKGGVYKSFFVDTFDVSTGELTSEYFQTFESLSDTYSPDEIVIKETSKLTSKMCTNNKHHETECLVSFLSGHWNTSVAGVRNLVRHVPEWVLLWMMMSRGIAGQHHSVDKFTPLYSPQPNKVVLCIRPQSSSKARTTEVLRVYRRFDGDISSLHFRQLAKPRVLIDMVHSVLLSLMYFAMYDQFHHFDIKPSNVLYRVTEHGDVETVLADYDSLCKLDNETIIDDVYVNTTVMYSSPLYPNFSESFDGMKHKSPLAPQHLSADDVRRSWNALIDTHAKSVRAPKFCDQLNQVIAKHDLYSLGCTLAVFRVGNKAHSKMVTDFIEDLLMAEDDVVVPNLRIRLNDDSRSLLPLHRPPRTQPNVRRRRRIMTISDAIDRLNELRIKLKLQKT